MPAVASYSVLHRGYEGSSSVKKTCERDRKPSSVVDDHLSRPGVTAQAQAIAGRDGQPHASHCILHQVGFTSRTSRQAAGELLPRLSTLTSGPKARGGISLLHSPWSRLHRPLTGTLPCGARTFLIPFGTRSPGHLTRGISYLIFLNQSSDRL